MGAVGLRDLNLTTYPWDEERMEPDVDAACKTIREVQPKVALFGQSVFLFPTPLEEMASAAKEVGASVLYDGATSSARSPAANSKTPSEKVQTS